MLDRIGVEYLFVARRRYARRDAVILPGGEAPRNGNFLLKKA